MPVSVPEKTLEHWCSMYLAYRYRAKIAMWWLVKNDDITIENLPKLPGKALSLEVKTSTPHQGKNSFLHDVKVDLGQLWEYNSRPKHEQPFYVIPWPSWSGELKTASRKAGVPATEIAYSRSGPQWWFAEWMRVLTTEDVARTMGSTLAAHGSTARGTAAKLVTLDSKTSVATWHNSAPPPTAHPWRDFWTTFQGCGLKGWPQTILLPARALSPTRSKLTRTQVLTALQKEARLIREIEDLNSAQQRAELGYDELVCLVPDNQGKFELQRNWRLQGSNLQRQQDEPGLQVVYADARIFS